MDYPLGRECREESCVWKKTQGECGVNNVAYWEHCPRAVRARLARLREAGEKLAEAVLDDRANNGPDFTQKSCRHPYLCNCPVKAVNAALSAWREAAKEGL